MMIKWFYPKARFVDRLNRIKLAADLAATIPFYGEPSIAEQDRRMRDPRMYAYHLLLWETSEHSETLRKIDLLNEKLKNMGIELSKLKREKSKSQK